MPHQMRHPYRHGGRAALLACLSLTVIACSNTSTDAGEGAQREGERAKVEKVPEIANSMPDAIANKGKLVVTMSTSSPPTHFETSTGMQGADVDVAMLLGEVLGLETEIVGVPLDQILPGLQAKRYDVVVSQFSATAERAQVLDFVDYAQYSTALGVPSGNPNGLAPDKLCGQRVAVQKGSVQAVEIVPDLSTACQEAGEPALQLQTFPESTATLLALQSGRVDSVLLDAPVLGYATTQSAKGKVEIAGTFREEPVAIGVVKGSGMDKPIQAALQHLDDKGLLQETWEQWGMNESAIHDFAINLVLSE